MKRDWRRVRWLVATVACTLLMVAPTRLDALEPAVVPGVLPEKWLNGGPNCNEIPQHYQVHEYNPDFYILRESGCLHYEKPFLFLIFGSDKALLLDTGAGNDVRVGSPPVDLAGTVEFVMKRWQARNNRPSLTLVVTHLHSHLDHIYGDFQFVNRPNTVFVPPSSVAVLQSFFGIRNWPRDIVQYDLGGRVLDVIPIPGHDDTSIAMYDRRTGVLLVGDTLYPGRIYINSEWNTFEESIRRLVDFTRERVVTHVIGTHIERRAPYDDYPMYLHYQPLEWPLAMGRAHLLEMLEATTRREKHGAIVQRIYREFTTCGRYPDCTPVNE